MFNTSKHSSERTSRPRDATLSERGPPSQRSRSRSARSSPSRHSECRSPWRVPAWVHCENCFTTHDLNPNLSLLSCGHIICRTCLHLGDDDTLHVACVRCKTSGKHIPINDSLDVKLHGMFEQGWMDPVLQLDVSKITFMMNKTQNYSKYLSKSIKQGTNVAPEWEERQNLVKKSMERIQKLKQMDSEVTKKAGVIKSEGMKLHNTVQMLNSMYEKAKTDFRLKQQQQQSQHNRGHGGQGKEPHQRGQIGQGTQQHHRGQGGQVKEQHHRGQIGPGTQHHHRGEGGQGKEQHHRGQVGQATQQHHRVQGGQGNYRQDMKLISSGRNEQSNQYIGQIKSSSHRPPVNQNQSAPDIRNFSQRAVPPARQNQSLNLPRGDLSRRTTENASNRSSMPSATFRPQPKNLSSDNRRFEPQQQHAAKRLVPSYVYDQYTNPPKRAAHYTGPAELNTSISSVGSSLILNPPRNGRPMNDLRFRTYK
ncbi:uncharacterized protein LOC119068778 isoform X2 [Bradysia coprophila]|uniref:uncharacterized protein LOC119068778 isoform X2 n=1 Tax=Bradysia coprophila TaxID=38358 RepID=UPI00187D716A|nr:uncharacterized protein LOC119068778 isoform X2 [Bradysia coprophila]